MFYTVAPIHTHTPNMAFKLGISSSTAQAGGQPEPTTEPPQQMKGSPTSSQSHSESRSECQAQPRPPLERTRTLSFSEPIRPSRSKDRSGSTISSYSPRSQPGTPENERSDRLPGRKTRSPSPYPKPQGPPSDDEDEDEDEDDDEDEISDRDRKARRFFTTLTSRIRSK
ncbi:unnamed protein product [Periconia digitata]|uniref:Uncharacterized protein n=1 Tax=Periconia digitata TaxID=1303443 RepID=A0A9W4UAX5_9PLEO|nr:unnamed protein product [Periconia digitata]